MLACVFVCERVSVWERMRCFVRDIFGLREKEKQKKRVLVQAGLVLGWQVGLWLTKLSGLSYWVQFFIKTIN